MSYKPTIHQRTCHSTGRIVMGVYALGHHAECEIDPMALLHCTDPREVMRDAVRRAVGLWGETIALETFDQLIREV